MVKFQPAPQSILSLTNFDKLFLLREDLNPNGSFKDRALSHQIRYLKKNKIDTCVISSSGNAAIAAADHCVQNNIKCIILVSPNTEPAKFSQIIKHRPFLLIKSRLARRLANYISKKYHIHNLTPSKDPLAITGYHSLGKEIHTHFPSCQIIFSYVTSGTSLIGIHNYYYQQKLKQYPFLVGVQSGQHTKLAKLFGQKITNELRKKQLAGANAPNPILYRKIFNMLANKYPIHTTKKLIHPQQDIAYKIDLSKIFTQGRFSEPQRGIVYWINHSKINHTLSQLHQHNIESSAEGAASLTAAIDFSQQYPNLKNAVVIISGTQHELLPIPKDFLIHVAETKEDIDQLLN